MCKISSYLKIENLLNKSVKSCAKIVVWLLSSSGVSKDWTQGKNTLSFIEIRWGKNVLVGSRSAKLHAYIW